MVTRDTSFPIAANNVCGVLVTYKPDSATIQKWHTHLEQLSQLIIIDNGSKKAHKDLNAFAKKQPQTVTILTHPQNNLAAAQNQGIRAARERGAQAVLLLDDDSVMEKGMLEHLCAQTAPHIGLVAPHIVEQGSSHTNRYAVPLWRVLFQRKSPEHHPIINGSFSPIASGSLIPMQVLEQVGLMDESFGIDYVDRDFCLRLLTHGYDTLIVAEARLQHRLGNSEEQTLAGHHVICRNHSPERRHSIFRNRLRCWARYGLSVPSFLFYDFLAAAYDIVRIIAYEEDKSVKLRAAFEGALSAITGKSNV